MAKVLGIGGLFFKSPDPRRLVVWYQKWLGFPGDSPDYVAFSPETMPDGASSVFSPFKSTTDHFAPSSKDFMFNLVVDDLEGALQQVEAGGGSIVDEMQSFAYGRFGWFLDPDGNKVELWQPAANVEP